MNTEVGHLPAGLSHWTFGRFDLYRVNPPLVRMVGALPLFLVEHKTDWSNYSLDPLTRSETAVGVDFVNANGERSFWLYTLGRWACIPFCWVGAWVCYRWSKDMYGPIAALAALCLWCFDPNILGHGALIMPDVPSAALGAAACYTFWRWLREPTWTKTLTAGAVLGLAELTKTTLIVFYPLWPLLWVLYRLPERKTMTRKQWGREAGMIIARIAVAIYIVNLGYGFEGSFQRLGNYHFQSHALTGFKGDAKSFPPGNRFADSWLAYVPVPLPKNYIQGIDTQKVDFERGMRSYLGGEWSDRGWWYFYFYAGAIKIPLGTLLLFALAIVVSIWQGVASWRTRKQANRDEGIGGPKGPRAREQQWSSIQRCTAGLFNSAVAWRDEMLLLFPAIILFVLVSSQTGFSIHFRYVFPVFPYLFIWSSKLFACGKGTV